MDQIICPNPNCGYRGEPEKRAKGSWEIALLLFIVSFVPAMVSLAFFDEWGGVGIPNAFSLLLIAGGFIPGLTYLAVMSGYKYACPNCGIQVGSD